MTNDVDEAEGWMVPLNGYLYDVTTDKEVLNVCSKPYTEGYSFISDLVSYSESLVQDGGTCSRSVSSSDVTLPASSSRYVSQTVTFDHDNNVEQSQIRDLRTASQFTSLEYEQFFTKPRDGCQVSNKQKCFLGMQPSNDTCKHDWEKNDIYKEHISKDNLLFEIASSFQMESSWNNANANTSTQSSVLNQATSSASHTGHQPMSTVTGDIQSLFVETSSERSHRQTELVHQYGLASGATFSGGNVVLRTSAEDKWKSESSEKNLPGVNDNIDNTSDFDILDICFDKLYNTHMQFTSNSKTEKRDLEMSSVTLSGQVSISDDMKMYVQNSFSVNASPPLITDVSSGALLCSDMSGSTNETLKQPEYGNHNTRCSFSTLTPPVCSLAMLNDNCNAFGNLPDTILDSAATSTDNFDWPYRHNLSVGFSSDSGSCTEPDNEFDGTSGEESLVNSPSSDSDIDQHNYRSYPSSSHQQETPSGVDIDRPSYQTPRMIINLHPDTPQPRHLTFHKCEYMLIRYIYEFELSTLLL